MNGVDILKQDLAYIQAMVRDLTNYLYSNVVYWPALEEGTPDLTLGGYLTRQRRLQILAYFLTKPERSELEQTVFQYKDLTRSLTATLEKKAILELGIRINQWEQNISEYRDSEAIEIAYFKTDAAVRTMIADLIFELEIDLNQVNQGQLLKIDALDHELFANWQEGDFIWPEEWIPAYGKGEYWWLYGLPSFADKE